MRILLVTEFFPKDTQLKFTGGVEARTYYLYKQLRKTQAVKVISRTTGIIPVTLFSIFDRLIFIISAILRGLTINTDIVEGSNFVSYFPAFIVAKLKRRTAVAWYPDVFLGTWTNKFGIVGLFGELAEQIVLKLPWDHFIALSNQTKAKLVKAGVNPSKVSVVYAGINANEFKLVKVAKYKSPTICCISRLVSYKRVEDLISALAIIKEKIPNIKLIIIGTGPKQITLKALSMDLGVSQSISWKSNLRRRELVKQLKKSHLFCLPSIVEGFGLVTLEAVAAGLPFVNTNIKINREVTHQGKGGLLFRPRNPQDLAEKVIRLLVEKKLYREKVTQGKELLKNYSWKKSAQETLAVYQSVINKHAIS